jgi:hypothetical protein
MFVYTKKGSDRIDYLDKGSRLDAYKSKNPRFAHLRFKDLTV